MSLWEWFAGGAVLVAAVGLWWVWQMWREL